MGGALIGFVIRKKKNNYCGAYGYNVLKIMWFSNRGYAFTFSKTPYLTSMMSLEVFQNYFPCHNGNTQGSITYPSVQN